MDDCKKIGERIKSQRRVAGLTQQELADKLGKSKRMVQHYEAGSTDITIDTVSQIAEILGIEARRLLYGDTDIEFKENIEKILFSSLPEEKECALAKEELDDLCELLNLRGLHKLLDYARDLAQLPGCQK